MRTICFDLRALQIGHENRGIGMYARSVLEHLPKDGTKYLFYCFDKNDPVKALGLKLAIDYEIVTTKTVNTILNSPKDIFAIYKLVHHNFKTLKPHKPDTFVQLDFTLGAPHWAGTKTVLIGYDLIPLIMKHEYMPSVAFAWKHADRKFRGVLRALYYRLKYRLNYRAYKRADKVICISEASAGSFKELLGIPESRLAVIPLAPVLSDAKPDYTLAGKVDLPYMLYVGGTDSRKRVEDIVRAYNIVRGRGVELALVLAGFEFQSLADMTDAVGKAAIAASPYKSDIHFTGFVSDSEKLGLYSKAWAFVFASVYEGFGLPVIEAMSASCPVVAYNNSSIPEAAGDAALLVKTGDYVGLANRVIELQDSSLREDLVRKGVKQAATFTWESYISHFQENL